MSGGNSSSNPLAQSESKNSSPFFEVLHGKFRWKLVRWKLSMTSTENLSSAKGFTVKPRKLAKQANASTIHSPNAPDRPVTKIVAYRRLWFMVPGNVLWSGAFGKDQNQYRKRLERYYLNESFNIRNWLCAEEIALAGSPPANKLLLITGEESTHTLEFVPDRTARLRLSRTHRVIAQGDHTLLNRLSAGINF